MAEVKPGETTFRRSAGGQILQAVASGVGGILFVGTAVLAAAGLLTSDLPPRLIGAAGFGFFGILMSAGAVAAARQAIDTRVASIGPAGAWLPGMGLLPWSDIADVRLERIRTVGGSSMAGGTRLIRRLGFVPRDRSLRPVLATNLVWRMAFAYFRLINAIAPQMRLGGDKPAPFGASELDLPYDFDRLVEAVASHVTIVDAAEARAHEQVARWSTPDPAANAGSPSLASLDAALARPRPPTGVAAADAPLVAPEVAAAAAQPRAVFVIPPIKPAEALFAVLSIVAPLLIIVPVVLPMALRGGVGAIPPAFILGLFAIFFVVPSLGKVGRLVRRSRDRGADPTRLRVGPDGIWTHGGGLVEWDGVTAIRTQRASYVRQIGRPPLERWRLVVESGSGERHVGSVVSDELDAPFDDVLELIRIYHPVVETS